jgi:hypothetical protein
VIARVPYGLPLSRSSVPKTYSIKKNQKSTLKNTLPWKPPKASKSKQFWRYCWSKITKKKGKRSSYESLKETSPKLSRGNSKKGSENHQKGKMGGTPTSL